MAVRRNWRLEPASVRTLARIALFTGLVALCCVACLLGGAPMDPSPIFLAWAGVSAGFAAALREHPLAPVLNRWDEAATFLGFAALAHAFARSTH